MKAKELKYIIIGTLLMLRPFGFGYLSIMEAVHFVTASSLGLHIVYFVWGCVLLYLALDSLKNLKVKVTLH